MAAMSNHHQNNPSITEDEDAKTSIEAQQLELSLPREKWCVNVISPYLYWYKNFWCPSDALHNVIALQAHFQAHDSDLLLATKPKSGTTWLKALAFSILNRRNHRQAGTHPLLSTNPHHLMPHLEYPRLGTHPLDVSKLDPPRLLATHLPYQGLPESVRSSGCRIVYLCRNPYDSIVSLVQFIKVLDEKEEDTTSTDLEKIVDSVCRGVEWYGPGWDHVLGYWNTSLEKPDKVLFMNYEDIKRDEISELKRLAEFLRAPFTSEEEEGGVIEEISKLCSLRNLKELEVNRSGRTPRNMEKKAFFRKGEVGDWKNHINPVLYERIEKVIEEKFHGTGLTFKTSI